MIDVRTEQILTLSQLVKRLPPHRNERPVHPATAHRWRKPGLHGIRLECVKIGGIWHTSMDAFQRFCDQMSSVDAETTSRSSGLGGGAKQTAESIHQEHVERALDEMGI